MTLTTAQNLGRRSINPSSNSKPERLPFAVVVHLAPPTQLPLIEPAELIEQKE